MASNTSQSIFWGLFLSLLLVSPSVLLAAGTKDSKPAKQDLDKELLKKYGSYRPKEILYLKDNMASGERVDLDNEYFKISYPKCFKVEPTVEDSDDVTIKNSASLDLTRTEKCSQYRKKKETNTIRVAFPNNMDFIEPERIEAAQSEASKVVYRQMIDVNHAAGVLFYEIGTSTEADHKINLNMVLTSLMACKGKTNEIYRISTMLAVDEEAIKIIKAKKFDLPKDIRQIISSFQCRKDR